jgi:hypothetical protein
MKILHDSQWRERAASPIAWHLAGFAALFLVVAFVAIRLGIDLATTHGRSTNALSSKQVELKLLDLEASPLRGLDKRVEESRVEMQAFYSKRIPPNYSSIATRIGELEITSKVRMSRVQYTQGPPGSDLTEISMDAGISGAYPEIMRFVNALERDQTFFVIREMALAGQQGGEVNLRLRVSTWMRPGDAAASGLPSTPESGQAAGPASASRQGGE